MVILIVISFALEAFIIELYCRKSFTVKAIDFCPITDGVACP